MKIYDCFQFFDENMMLDLRMNILDQYIYKFVIIENSYTHSGKKRKPIFDINNFSKFKNKIIYILVDNLPKGLKDFKKIIDEDERGNTIIDNTLIIEHNQRNHISRGVIDAEVEDLIIVSDVDEIPNLSNLNFSNIKKRLIHFKQKMYYYKFNLKYTTKPWVGSKACLKKNFISAQWLRDTKEKIYPLWRLDIIFSNMKYNSIYQVENGGWHFSNIKTPKDLFLKLENYGHHFEFQESGLKFEDIKKMMDEKRACYDFHVDMRGDKWSGKQKLYNCDTNELPKYLIKNKEKYSSWFD